MRPSGVDPAITLPIGLPNHPSYISGHLTITGGTGLDMFGGVQPIAAASTSAHFSDRYLPAGSYLFYGFQSDLNIKVRHHITLHRAL